MTAYAEWLLAQPADVQDDILGTENAERLRSGLFKVEKFVNNKSLSLEQFASKGELIASKSSKEPGNASTESK